MTRTKRWAVRVRAAGIRGPVPGRPPASVPPVLAGESAGARWRSRRKGPAVRVRGRRSRAFRSLPPRGPVRSRVGPLCRSAPVRFRPSWTYRPYRPYRHGPVRWSGPSGCRWDRRIRRARRRAAGPLERPAALRPGPARAAEAWVSAEPRRAVVRVRVSAAPSAVLARPRQPRSHWAGTWTAGRGRRASRRHLMVRPTVTPGSGKRLRWARLAGPAWKGRPGRQLGRRPGQMT